MIKRTLKEIKEMVDGFLLKKENEKIVIQGVSIDSRNIGDNQLFIPIKGERFNGHRFIEDVVKKGAAAALWNKDEPLPDVNFPFILVEDTLVALQQMAKAYRQQLNIKVIGITGSNGKTSTKDILASILKTRYNTHKTFGNLNNHLGVPLTLLEMEEDTEIAVIEMGMSDSGEIEILTSIACPDVAVITNIGEAHLSQLKSKENIIKAKLEILTGLKENGLFVYFGDDPLLKEKIESLSLDCQMVTFGHDSSNTYHSQIKDIKTEGISFEINAGHHPFFFLPALGKHQMLNATAAIVVARYFGLSFEQIQEGLLGIEMTGARNELIRTSNYTILNDSYKSNPTSLQAALETLYSLKQYKQKIAVLGDMNGLGEEEIKMHREIGRQIDPKEIDYLFTIGPLSDYIAKEAKLRFRKSRVFSCSNKTQLIHKLREVIEDQSVILIKGSRELELEEVVDALKEDRKIKEGAIM